MRMNSRLASVLFGALVLVGAAIFNYTALAATLRMTVNTAITGTYLGTNDLGSARATLEASTQPAIQLGSGTGSGQANVMFADQRTLSASTTENLDLFGVLTDPFGTTLSFATVKVIRVCAASANTNNVNVGPGLTNSNIAFTGPFNLATVIEGVKPGGCSIKVAPGTGWTVTNSTADMLSLGNSGSGTSVTYDITVIGTQ